MHDTCNNKLISLQFILNLRFKKYQIFIGVEIANEIKGYTFSLDSGTYNILFEHI